MTMFFWKKNKINKKFLGAKTVSIPNTAQKTIPFQEAYENGLFLNYDGSYSLIFSFENIDYSLYRDEEKQEIYKKYTQLINTIPTDIHFQEFLMNTDIDTGTLTETLLSASYDYPEIPLRFLINNQLSLKEIGTFATVYDMYLNGEMPITVSGICQHIPDGIVTIRKYVKRLIDKELLIRDHALIDGHIVMTLTVNMDRFRE